MDDILTPGWGSYQMGKVPRLGVALDSLETSNTPPSSWEKSEPSHMLLRLRAAEWLGEDVGHHVLSGEI